MAPEDPALPAHLPDWAPRLAPGQYAALLRRRARSDASLAARREAEAALRNVRPLDLAPRLGAAWFPAVLDAGHIRWGFLLRVSTRPLSGEDRPAPPELARRAGDWLARLAGLPSAEGLSLPPLYLGPMPPDFELEGRSSGLAAAVALLSHLLQLAPREPVLVSAALDIEGEPGNLLPVDRVDEKRRVAGLEAPKAAPFLCEQAQDARPLLSRWFPGDWPARLQGALDVDPDTLALEAYQVYKRRDYEATGAKARAALEGGARGRFAGIAHWLLGGLALHRGEPAEASRRLDQGARLLTGPWTDEELRELPRRLWEEFLAQWGVSLVDLGRPAEAVRALEEALAGLEGLDAEVASLRVQLAGTLHRALLLDGRLEEALSVLERRSLPLAPRSERARVLGDLAELHRRAGRLEAAREALERAWAELRYTSGELRQATQRFLCLYRARAGMEEPPWPAAEADWSDWPQPAEVAETLLRGAPAELERWLRSALEAAGEPVQRFFLLGVLARHLQAGSELPDWGARAARETAELPGIEEGVRRALRELAGGRPQSWLLRCPY